MPIFEDSINKHFINIQEIDFLVIDFTKFANIFVNNIFSIEILMQHIKKYIFYLGNAFQCLTESFSNAQ